MNRSLIALSALALFGLTFTASAEGARGGHAAQSFQVARGAADQAQPGRHKGPPPQAFEACEGLKAGAACSFEGRDGEELAGQCFTPSADKPLACRPENAPKRDGDGPCMEGGKGGPKHGPPPEAIDACEGLKAGATCSFEGRDGEEVSGQCFTPSADKPLACRPDNPPMRQGQGQGQGRR